MKHGEAPNLSNKCHLMDIMTMKSLLMYIGRYIHTSVSTITPSQSNKRPKLSDGDSSNLNEKDSTFPIRNAKHIKIDRDNIILI